MVHVKYIVCTFNHCKICMYWPSCVWLRCSNAYICVHLRSGLGDLDTAGLRSCDQKCDVTREKGCGPSGMGWGWGVRIIFTINHFNLNPWDRDWDWNNLLRKLFWPNFTGIEIEITCFENYSYQISPLSNSAYYRIKCFFLIYEWYMDAKAMV